MSEEKQSDHWWQTVPGVLTGLAALITAIGSLLVGLNPENPNENSENQTIWGIDLPAYVVLDSAWKTKKEAQSRLVKLNNSSYSNTGFFWIPDFEFLSGTRLYQVYIGPFKDLKNAIKAACEYDEKNLQTNKTYGVKLSSKPGRKEFRCSDMK